MYITDLPGLRILSVISALRMGTVESALVDASCRFVAALRVREPGPGGHQLIPREMVKRVGRHAVIIARDLSAEANVLEHAEQLIPLRGLIGLEVVSDRGDLLGYVRDVEVDRDTLTLERVEIAQTRIDRALRLRPPLRVDAQLVIRGSQDAMLLPETAFEAAAAGITVPLDETQPTQPYARADTRPGAHPDVVRWRPPNLPGLDGDRDRSGTTAMG
jgi:sporulation protein YlmC with PRC-barrel domain